MRSKIVTKTNEIRKKNKKKGKIITGEINSIQITDQPKFDFFYIKIYFSFIAWLINLPIFYLQPSSILPLYKHDHW